MTKKLALLLMLATLFFVETILKDGGDLDRIADTVPGSAPAPAADDSAATAAPGIAALDVRRKPSHPERNTRTANVWDEPSPSDTEPEDYGPVAIQQPAARRPDSRSSGSRQDGALAPDQLNLEK
jgi:hypothetical protein